MEKFTYLGSMQSNVVDIEKNIKNWIKNACLAFRQLQTVWGSKVNSLKVKLRLYT